MITAAAKPPRSATLADLLALPDEGQGYEIIDGQLVEKETSAEHAQAQARLASRLGHRFDRRPGGRWPGGWWFLTEPLIRFPTVEHPLRPDVAGWRRDRCAACPRGAVIDVVPDWICEILSTNFTNDTIKKKRIYHDAGVGHYWLLDPVRQTLQVYRREPGGYLEVLAAERHERVRAEPFQADEVPVGVFFGDDDDGDE